MSISHVDNVIKCHWPNLIMLVIKALIFFFFNMDFMRIHLPMLPNQYKTTCCTSVIIRASAINTSHDVVISLTAALCVSVWIYNEPAFLAFLALFHTQKCIFRKNKLWQSNKQHYFCLKLKSTLVHETVTLRYSYNYNVYGDQSTKSLLFSVPSHSFWSFTNPIVNFGHSNVHNSFPTYQILIIFFPLRSEQYLFPLWTDSEIIILYL